MTALPTPAEIVRIPFRDNEVLTVDVDGRPHVILKPAFEAIGIDADRQIRNLRARSWATTAVTAVVALDGKTRDMVTADVRTFLMTLATIPETRVREDARPLLVAYQAEVADAIEAYWTQGGAINPRATEDQLDAITRRAHAQMEVLALGSGLISADWLEAKARHVAARALGEEPEVDPARRPLTVGEYLADRGVSATAQRSLAGPFGKSLKKLYRDRHDAEPPQVERFVDGAIRNVAAYTEADRDLFDAAFVLMGATR